MKYDLYLVGVGGQGVLTIGDILAEAARMAEMPVNFFPSRGMAQRGGFVKAQLRFGRSRIGPHIPERGADLVISLELSEALKAVRFVKQQGHFILVGDIWAPTAVLLGKAAYPTQAQVADQVKAAGAQLTYIDPDCLPTVAGQSVPTNIFALGVAVNQTSLGTLFAADAVAEVIQSRWKLAAAANLNTFQAGLDFNPATSKPALEAKPA